MFDRSYAASIEQQRFRERGALFLWVALFTGDR